MLLRDHLMSLRRKVDASSFFFDEATMRSSPKPMLERIRCHQNDLHAVHQTLHETNPTDVLIEIADLPRNIVEVTWLTEMRKSRTDRFHLI